MENTESLHIHSTITTNTSVNGTLRQRKTANPQTTQYVAIMHAMNMNTTNIQLHPSQLRNTPAIKHQHVHVQKCTCANIHTLNAPDLWYLLVIHRLHSLFGRCLSDSHCETHPNCLLEMKERRRVKESNKPAIQNTKANWISLSTYYKIATLKQTYTLRLSAHLSAYCPGAILSLQCTFRKTEWLAMSRSSDCYTAPVGEETALN